MQTPSGNVQREHPVHEHSWDAGQYGSPSLAVAGPAIFAFWDDLHLIGAVFRLHERGRPTGALAIILLLSLTQSVSSVRLAWRRSDFRSFFTATKDQAAIQYHSHSTACDSSQTVGIQSNGTAGSPALTYVCSTTGIIPSSGLAIWFYDSILNMILRRRQS